MNGLGGFIFIVCLLALGAIIPAPASANTDALLNLAHLCIVLFPAFMMLACYSQASIRFRLRKWRARRQGACL